MELYFITGNKMKLDEARVVFPDIKQLEVDLAEIQEMDSTAIIAHKLDEALQHREGPFIVDDTSVHMDALGGLPGPFIKWFLHTIGNNGLASIAERMGNSRAIAKTWIGYASPDGEKYFFEGSVSGTIVTPQSESRSSWNQIFVPDGSNLPFSEMNFVEKSAIDMRGQALKKLQNFLQQNT